MEAAMGGELKDYIRVVDSVPEKQARYIILQTVHAMLYCHNRGVVHRDLKLENVLFKNKDYEEDFIVKVVDFGIAGVGGDKVDAGTISYMAPECFEHKCMTTPAIDVWAIGVMFYAMMFGSLPFHANTEKEIINAIKNNYVKFPNDIPITQECKEIIKSMLHKDPLKRLQLLDFMNMPYVLWEEEEVEQKILETK